MSRRQADLFDISKATDIHGTRFDDPANPVSPNGVLDSSITPAEYVPFVNFLDGIQLARLGLHNGKHDERIDPSDSLTLGHILTVGDPNDQTLIDAKWESLALAPCGDPDFPDDYFLFTAVRTISSSFVVYLLTDVTVP